MSVDRDTVRRIARLARIDVPDDDLDELAGELSRILHWVERLDELDAGDAAATAGPGAARLRLRPDEVTEGGIAGKIVANAPARRDGMFAVPKPIG